MIGNYEDEDADEDGIMAGEGESQMEEDGPDMEEDTFKEEISPNEACYIDIEHLEANTLIPLNDSMARQKANLYKEESKIVNDLILEVWDANKH